MKRFLSLTGFSLIELLVVVAIFAVISSLGLAIGLNFYRGYVLNSERNIFVSILTKTRSKAVSNINQSPEGVFINSGNYTIFQGSSYASRNQAYDEVISINPSVTPSGLGEIVFGQLSGSLLTPSGDVNFTNGQRSVTVSVNDEGRINW
ncbi:MAG: prepilin-type N-terminal cleavage/methylation domain-containing protein [Candidatus Colwellbacteria bacterium]|nr:prepilin-type N-terminal cleavage/methylation domain-containing protein [Candidatus Colwellbacteria bacterium]MBI3274174.1 prepilin-type N-terminal cleavage/methylation domain-containing protein [Candidatus Colwellbacteria bacterium]